MSRDTIVIEAGREAVERLLDKVLTPEQRREVTVVAAAAEPDPLSPPQRGEGVALVLLQFAASAIAGGVLYDLVKVAVVKSYGAARVHFRKPDEADGSDPES